MTKRNKYDSTDKRMETYEKDPDRMIRAYDKVKEGLDRYFSNPENRQKTTEKIKANYADPVKKAEIMAKRDATRKAHLQEYLDCEIEWNWTTESTIYLITVHYNNGELMGNYVGRTIQPLYNRIAMHLKKELFVDKCMREYDFDVHVLEICPEEESADKEIEYIDILGTYKTHPYGLNRTRGGELTVRDFDMDVFREKLAERSRRDTWRINQSKSQRATKNNKEYRSMMSRMAKERYSDEVYLTTKERASLARGDPDYRAIVSYVDGQEPIIYEGLVEVVKAVGLSDIRSFKRRYLGTGRAYLGRYYVRLCDYKKMKQE